MALARSFQNIVSTVFKGNVNTVNANAYPECQFTQTADGTWIQKTPEACHERMLKEDAARKSWLNSPTVTGIVSAIAGFVPVIGTASSIALKAGQTVQTLQTQDTTLGYKPTTFAPTGGRPMGLFDDIWGGVQNAATGIFSGSQNSIDWNGLLQGGVGLATQALAPRKPMAPVQTAAFAPATMAAAPAIARAGAVVGRSFFNRFPSLATSIQTLRNSGMNVTRAKLYGVMKRFGPEFLVTGGLLTAAAVNELAVAGPGHRRMNPANVRALRRSVRRIESFHRLCKTTDSLRRRKR